MLIFAPSSSKEKNHNLHSSPNIIRINIAKMIRWARHVARLREETTRKNSTVLIRKDSINMDGLGGSGLDLSGSG
jgi:hypothetical protein